MSDDYETTALTATVCGQYINDEIETKEELLATLDATPKDDLRELVEEWRDNSNLRKPAWECADELEELIEDE